MERIEMILYKPRDLFCQEFGDGRSGRYNGKLKSGDGASSTQFCSITIFFFLSSFSPKETTRPNEFPFRQRVRRVSFFLGWVFFKELWKFWKRKKIRKGRECVYYTRARSNTWHGTFHERSFATPLPSFSSSLFSFLCHFSKLLHINHRLWLQHSSTLCVLHYAWTVSFLDKSGVLIESWTVSKIIPCTHNEPYFVVFVFYSSRSDRVKKKKKGIKKIKIKQRTQVRLIPVVPYCKTRWIVKFYAP